MSPITIAPGMAPEHLASLALSIHNVVGRMPVAVKARSRPGVLVADGRVRNDSYECKAFDSIFRDAKARKATADGDYDGIPMYVSAICGQDGRAVAALGVIDTAGVLGLQEFAEISARLACQSDKKGRPAK